MRHMKEQMTPGAKILKDGPYETAKRLFESYPSDAQEEYSKAANATVRHTASLEPRLKNSDGDYDKSYVHLVGSDP